MHYLYYKTQTFATYRRYYIHPFHCNYLNVAGILSGGCMNGTNRSDIIPGMKVAIVLKKDQRTGTLTEGVVKDILTKSPQHPHGIKVRLEGGEIGRVKKILDRNSIIAGS
jgi:uncharacterized repeat protein (TIGR03833 family)